MTVEVGRNERSFESKKSSHEIDSVQSTKMGLNLRARRKAVDINGTTYDVLDYGRGTVNVVYECIPVPFPFLRHNQISKNLVFPARGLAAVRLVLSWTDYQHTTRTQVSEDCIGRASLSAELDRSTLTSTSTRTSTRTRTTTLHYHGTQSKIRNGIPDSQIPPSGSSHIGSDSRKAVWGDRVSIHYARCESVLFQLQTSARFRIARGNDVLLCVVRACT